MSAHARLPCKLCGEGRKGGGGHQSPPLPIALCRVWPGALVQSPPREGAEDRPRRPPLQAIFDVRRATGAALPRRAGDATGPARAASIPPPCPRRLTAGPGAGQLQHARVGAHVAACPQVAAPAGQQRRSIVARGSKLPHAQANPRERNRTLSGVRVASVAAQRPDSSRPQQRARGCQENVPVSPKLEAGGEVPPGQLGESAAAHDADRADGNIPPLAAAR